MVAIRCVDGATWRRVASAPFDIWLRGHGGIDTDALAKSLSNPDVGVADEVARLLKEAKGHFALIARGPGWVCAAVDWVRSIPLFHARVDGRWMVDDQAERLRKAAGFGTRDVNADAVLAIAMAGYTVDRATLYHGLHMLGPGELVFWRDTQEPVVRRYYTYRPWQIAQSNRTTELREVTLDIVERMVRSLEGRPLIVPLSAGYDSRLVVSAVAHLGYRNVRCFAYGRANSFEMKASRAVAERLGYPWRFVSLTPGLQRQFFASHDYADYIDYADTCASVPFVQDMTAIEILKKQGYIPPDAVFANGNSGDYISGMHIDKAMRSLPVGLNEEARKERILQALADKHFALWRILRTPANIARIKALVWASIERAGGMLGDPVADHGLYEYAEFQDRQCKYVVTGQRIYEFLGHEWRLPLWDNSYLAFWQGVPLRDKAGQALYKGMLMAADWGGVWRGIPLNRKTVRPNWLVPLRLVAKALHVPLGADRWHTFERRYLQYWMDLTGHSACVPYRRVATDRRGARHVVAWLAELYLARHKQSLPVST